jgi:hypothetical protein
MFMNRRSKEQRTSGDDGFTVFQNGNGRNIERSSLLPSSSATPASAAGRFRGAMDNSAYPDDGVCVCVCVCVGFLFLFTAVCFQGGSGLQGIEP